MRPFKVLQERPFQGFSVWKRIQSFFETHPEWLQVAEFLVKNGFSIRSNRILVNEVEIPTVKVVRAIGVDRRTLSETTRTTDLDKKVKTIFRVSNILDHRSGQQPSSWDLDLSRQQPTTQARSVFSRTYPGSWESMD